MFEHVAILKRNPVPLPAILGLDQVPGDPKVQRRFFFKSPLIAQRLAMLNNMVGGRSLVIVVTGERGSGKTTLMNQFIANAGKRCKTGRIRLKPQRKGQAAHWRNLNSRMWFVSAKNRPPSVIIDDAHQLRTAEIKILLQSVFAPTGERRLQSIVLFAEPGMRQRFAEIARWLPPQSVIEKIFMTPLTEKQTMDYLRHRLKTAGMLSQNPFSGDQMRKIYQLSGGLPGWINGEAFMLLRKMKQPRKGFRPSFISPLIKVFHGQNPMLLKELTCDAYACLQIVTACRLLR